MKAKSRRREAAPIRRSALASMAQMIFMHRPPADARLKTAVVRLACDTKETK